MNVSTITLDINLKKRLDRLKAHPRESYNDIILRLLSGKRGYDFNSLQETIEILSDPDIMKSLAQSLHDLRKGRLYNIEEV